MVAGDQPRFERYELSIEPNDGFCRTSIKVQASFPYFSGYAQGPMPTGAFQVTSRSAIAQITHLDLHDLFFGP